MDKSAAFLVTIAVTLILISLLTLGVVCVQPVKAEDQGNITINADGSITPSTAPIQQTGTIYSLTSNVAGSITVNASNIVFDGNGHTVTGISLQGTSNVAVKNFLVVSQGERFGLSLSDASNNLIINNTVSGFWSIQALNGISFGGISVLGGNSNTITQNNLIDNLLGMGFGHTSYNLIVQNNITSNPVWSPYTTGISFVDASDNFIYRNNIVNNHYQTQVSNSINTWDDGYLGNYWSDYQTKYPYAGEIGGSEIGNTQYVIDEQNVDRYPLLQPFDSALYAPRIMPKISILSPVNQVINESSVPLVFTVDKQVSWMGYSLDGQDNVTVTGNSTLNGLANGLHKIIVYANDTFGNMCASETLTFSVAVPAPAPFVLASAGLGIAVLVVGVGLFYYVKKRLAASKGR
jgi:parallel beta-helix repeat protein